VTRHTIARGVLEVSHTDDANAVHAIVAAIVARMKLYQEDAEDCLSQLDNQQVWYRAHPGQNAIGNLILHVVGNLQQIANNLSRKPDVRDRPAEFQATGGKSREELSVGLRSAVTVCCHLLESLPIGRLTEPYRIQSTDTTVAYALIMAVSHFGLHLGQIQYIAKGLLRDMYREAVRRAPK
jgi:hypothetical protein